MAEKKCNNMRVLLPYGHSQISAEIPRSTTVQLAHVKNWRVSHRSDIVRNALLRPVGFARLRELAAHVRNAVIVTCDKTRDVPSKITLPLILRELRGGGLKEKDIELLIATGLHKDETRVDVKERLGGELLDQLNVTIHDSDDQEQLRALGNLSSGTPLYLNSAILESDLVITESTLEPHFFAGFTGGSKVILPGLAGTETILANHSYGKIDDPKARYGILQNPIREDSNEALRSLKRVYALNLILDSKKKLVHATSGHSIDSFNVAARSLTLHSKVLVKKRPDVVITTNGGYPLDRNLYQCVKGIAVPEEIVHNDSRIIMVAECGDGTVHSEFRNLLRGASADEIYSRLRTAKETVRDQWQVQVLCRILRRNQVWFVTRKQLRPEIESMHMHYASTVEEALEGCELSKGERVLVASQGPSLILKAG